MPDRHFDFQINNLDDVKEHLDALWYVVNQLLDALKAAPPECTDPPDTCGSSVHGAKPPGKQVRPKRSVKKAKG